MNIALISLDRELFCIGVRTLSACLRQAGHQVRCIFLPPGGSESARASKYPTGYSPDLLAQLRTMCRDVDLIGLSLMTSQFIQARSVTKWLKEAGRLAPVIWGGIHPTVEPEVCLESADMICRGEGETAFVELAEKMERGQPYGDTRNFWFSSKKQIVRNPVRPLEQDLDRIPLPDYSCLDHYVAKDNDLDLLTREELLRFKGVRYNRDGKSFDYPIMTSRGCPFSCTYCCNDTYRELYPGEKFLRWRSVKSVLGELRTVQEDVAPLSFVFVVDDNFTARPLEELKRFGEAYKAEVGRPFFCQCSPLTISEEKMEVLLSAGCQKIAMGVETGDERVARMYKRQRFHAAVPRAIAVIEKYRPRMATPPSYQFIIDNPYESLDETLKTLQLAVSLPRPWDNPIYSLMLYPGTLLYARARDDGLIQDKETQVYGRSWLEQRVPYFQLWVKLYRANAPRVLLRLLLNKRLVRLLTGRPLRAFWGRQFIRRLWV